jgi:RND family efflux transporter MFP subunit
LSNPDIVAEGVVREVSPIADPTTRTFQIKVTLNNPPEQMLFGASIRGRLKTVTAPVVVLPLSTLFDQAGKPAVWLFDTKTSTVKLKQVTLARIGRERIIISDGLVKGDIVVTAGVNRLHEGQKVRLLPGADR